MNIRQLQQDRAGQPFFVTRMFDETMKLLIDAHNYFSILGPHDNNQSTPLEKLVYSAEMSRITLRLSSVMAWLLARRAEHAGNISRSEAVEQFRLGFSEICLQELPEMQQVLPRYMCELMERSYRLYERVARLDDMMATETIH